MDRKPVELVRVEREEQYFEREAVLGRDLTSVFPTESRKAAAAEGQALIELLGNKKFISETELEEIKSQRGLRPEDGTIAADKPLAEILREAKEAKEAAFQDQWKQMKQGKNRPLDEDELEFLDSVAEQEAERLKRVRQEEEAELAAFHAAQMQQQEGQQGAAGDAAGRGQQPGAGAGPAAAHQQVREKKQQQQQQAVAKKQPMVVVKPLVRPIVRVKGSSSGGSGPAAAAAGGSEPDAKRQRTEQADKGGSDSDGGPGLAGLLGGYGSGSESDS